MITLADVEAAARRIAGAVRRTPTLAADAVSRAAGAEVTLKLDNLQVTGAFKERGAANRLALLSAAERARGVIAMSAGNHAQAVARHARLLGVAATIVMPSTTPATKVTRTASWGAEVVLHGTTLAEAAAHAHALAAQRGLVFIHPYDDPAVMAGQGTLALELLDDAPGLDTLVVPVGGGGLLAGCAVAARGRQPGIAVFGVEVE
ncbi:MAG: pyridoxal-phosphate dependent enzyme, partial [Acetobacteraceae bacterium]